MAQVREFVPTSRMFSPIHPSRQLVRLSQSHPKKGLKWLAEQMRQWELQVQLSRPPGATQASPETLLQGMATSSKYDANFKYIHLKMLPSSRLLGLSQGSLQCRKSCLECLFGDVLSDVVGEDRAGDAWGRLHHSIAGSTEYDPELPETRRTRMAQV